MIKIGVIGAGNITNTFCQAVNQSVKGAKLEAIASRSLKNAEKYKEKYAFSKAYGSYEELYEDKDIDLIYIATPHGFHYEQMMRILDFNKHILCEKSFTLNQVQAKEVFAKAKDKNVFMMEAMWTRFLPVIRELQKDIKNNIIGEINYLEADFCFIPDKTIDHRLFQPILGGGALLDVGIYPITFANLFMGIPKRFESKVEMFETGVDIYGEIEYIYDKGKAVLRAGLNVDLPHLATIKGTKGTILVEGLHATESAKIYNNHNELIKHIQIPHESNGFEYEIREVIKCINNGKTESSIMPHQTTLNILKQMDDIRKSWNFSYPQEL